MPFTVFNNLSLPELITPHSSEGDKADRIIRAVLQEWSGAFRALALKKHIHFILDVENAYVPIAIFNVIYVQYKLDKSAYARFVRFLELKNDEQLQKGKIPAGNAGEICVRNLHFEYEEKTALDEVAFAIIEI